MSIRRRICVTGVVQGVGFRPFVYRTATELELRGWVRNDASGVVLEVEGPRAAVDELCRRLAEDPPPLARVHGTSAEDVPPTDEPGFTIVPTTAGGRVDVPGGVDTAPCEACRGELFDPADRRHRYPFLSCTDCGPRFTIVRQLPYDRASTTMAGFALCGPCRAEFEDPTDRRFHAQPTACRDCGPRLSYLAADGTEVAGGDAALAAAVEALGTGAIVAVKGVGGYHLACLATDATAVATLRTRKAREGKPFAVLVADLEAAERLAHLTAHDRAVLAGSDRSVVLVPARGDTPLADGIAPGLADVGLLLPPSPLHELIAHDVGAPVVLTSGNVAGEPIAHTDDDAVVRLGPLVDALLIHDRPIHIRCDDSVVRGGMDGPPLTLRRSRGRAPAPLPLPGPGGPDALALGGHLKNTVAVARAATATVSHHVGDLDAPAARAALRQAIDHLCHLADVEPVVIAHDLHPEYHTTAVAEELAREWGVPTVAVQHHHAHVASCLVEHRRVGPVLGVAFDGLGYGTDGTIWGGEFLVADLATSRRVGHLRTVPQPGGDAATRQPWRMAVAWTQAACGDAIARAEGERHDPRATEVLSVTGGPLTPITSSAGRLFDAVAALLGIRGTVSYEGQAAMQLEAAAAGHAIDRTGRVAPALDGVLDPTPLLVELLRRRDAGAPVGSVAAWFHDAFAASVAALADELAGAYGLDTVVLTGGVFCNRRLTAVVAAELEERGRTVLRHGDVPCNDGGISLGQLAVARSHVLMPSVHHGG